MNINYKDIQLNLEFKITNCLFETKQFTTFPFPSKNTGSLFFALVSFKLMNERLLFTVELLTENCSLFNPHFVFHSKYTFVHVYTLSTLYSWKEHRNFRKHFLCRFKGKNNPTEWIFKYVLTAYEEEFIRSAKCIVLALLSYV